MCRSFALMNQSKYLIYAILILLVVTGTYFVIQKISETKVVDNRPVVIDDYKPAEGLVTSSGDGKMLFMSNCASCHSIFKSLTGPALTGIEKRGPWSDSAKLYKYIRHPESFSGNKYIDSLRMYYGSKHMGFPDLSDNEIQKILKYINN